jgi:hypothetical protein
MKLFEVMGYHLSNKGEKTFCLRFVLLRFGATPPSLNLHDDQFEVMHSRKKIMRHYDRVINCITPAFIIGTQNSTFKAAITSTSSRRLNLSSRVCIFSAVVVLTANPQGQAQQARKWSFWQCATLQKKNSFNRFLGHWKKFVGCRVYV